MATVKKTAKKVTAKKGTGLESAKKKAPKKATTKLAAKAKAPAKPKKKMERVKVSKRGRVTTMLVPVSKKKLGGAKTKPKDIKTPAAAGDHWFFLLSKKAQADYIKAHPNSKFAKGGKTKGQKQSVQLKTELKTNKIQLRKTSRELASADRKLRKAKRVADKHAAAKPTTPAAKAKARTKRIEAKQKVKSARLEVKRLSADHKQHTKAFSTSIKKHTKAKDVANRVAKSLTRKGPKKPKATATLKPKKKAAPPVDARLKKLNKRIETVTKRLAGYAPQARNSVKIAKAKSLLKDLRKLKAELK